MAERGEGILKINVSLSGRFRDIFQAKDLEIELKDGGNIRDLLNFLCDTHERRSNIFDTSKTRLKPAVTITRNGRFIIHLDWLDTKLAEGDSVMIFTLHAGG